MRRGLGPLRAGAQTCTRLGLPARGRRRVRCDLPDPCGRLTAGVRSRPLLPSPRPRELPMYAQPLPDCLRCLLLALTAGVGGPAQGPPAKPPEVPVVRPLA